MTKLNFVQNTLLRSRRLIRQSLLALLSIASLALTLNPAVAVADDWPQWLGPNRDSIWHETGILEKFPEDGLTVKWRKPIGYGYAGPAVAGGKVFVMDYQKESGKIGNDPGSRDKLDGKERILCYDANTGDLLWKHEYERIYSISYGGGPRCTPAVADGKVYALGAEGNLSCLNAEDGKVIWEKDLQKAYKIRTGNWGFSGHPLVDGDTLYCLVGGKGSVAVAFDKDTGEEKWRALSATKEPGYCPPVMIEHGGTKQVLFWHPQSLNALDPKTGDVLWSYPLKPAYEMSCASPRKFGDRLFVSAIGKVAVMLKLAKDGKSVEPIWRGTPKSAVYCSNSTAIFDNQMIYGCDVESSALIGVRASDGKRLWETSVPIVGKDNARDVRHGTSFLIKNGKRFFIFSETGDLILANLSGKSYQEISRFKILEPTNNAFGRPVVWSHPAFAEKSIFTRNDSEIVCVDLAAPK